MHVTPRSAVIYARISDARADEEDAAAGRRGRVRTTKGVDDQVKRCRELAARLGWSCGPDATHVIIENDTSAFKRRRITLPDGSVAMRVVRPGWRHMLGMLADGGADGLICLDLDRACRDPRDLEDLADLVQSRRPWLPVESVTGSLRLATDGDLTMARVLVAMANKSSRDTGRRVAAARERQAAAGGYLAGGKRPFGYEPGGMVVRAAEAQEVRRAAEALLDGVSLREVTAGLRLRGVPTVTGATWQPGTVRDILLRARNAGIAVYRGEEIGPALWPAILAEPQWRAVAALLTDPGRNQSPGPAPRWLVSMTARCGRCGGLVSAGGGRHGRAAYTCREANHLRRVALPVDELVSKTIIARLSRPDAADMLATRPGVDTAALSRTASAARQRLDVLGRMFGSGEIDRRQLREGSAQAKAGLDQAQAALVAAAASDPLAAIAGRGDAAAVWEVLDVAQRRAIVRLLMNVILLPARGGRCPGGSYFDPATVRIEWKR